MILQIDNYYDNALSFYDKNPYFYDRYGLFWFWNPKLFRYEMRDETDLLNLFDKELAFYGATIGFKVRQNYLEAFKRVGRRAHPLEAKQKWIQFKDQAYDLKGHFHPVDYKYFFTNPIPWHIAESSETPQMDTLFEQWVGKDNVRLCYEMLAYACFRGTPIHRIFVLYGSGSNGKSQFLKIMRKFIGKENTVSTEIDLLAGLNKSRFETFKLYKKLVCEMGETNFGTMSQTSIIKKIAAGDLISYEKKGKDAFDGEVYAKLIIASNSLPASEDTSDGFYRRWIVIRFPNIFPEGKEIFSTIPDQEYSNLAKKVTEILPKLLESGKFTNEGSIEDRKRTYLEVSNPLSIFIEKFCELSGDKYVSSGKLYTAYVQWLLENKHRKVNRREFNAALVNEGLYIEHTSKKENGGDWKTDNWVIGIDLNESRSIRSTRSLIPISPPYIGSDIVNSEWIERIERKFDKIDDLYAYFCQNSKNDMVFEESDLLKLYIEEDKLYLWLEKLAYKGVIFSPRPMAWKLLK